MRPTPRALVPLLSLVVAGLAAAGPASAGPLYLRVAAGYEESADTTVLDRDCASRVPPPALFGCVDGPDGRRLAARGDFGETEVVDVGVGRELSSRLRAELALSLRPGLGPDAESNFLDVTEDQPVSADAESLAGIVVLCYELGPATWRSATATWARCAPTTARRPSSARTAPSPWTSPAPGRTWRPWEPGCPSATGSSGPGGFPVW